jgi:hypothetical protein
MVRRRYHRRQQVAKAASHTLLLHTSAWWERVCLYRKLQYKPLEDFESSA